MRRRLVILLVMGLVTGCVPAAAREAPVAPATATPDLSATAQALAFVMLTQIAPTVTPLSTDTPIPTDTPAPTATPRPPTPTATPVPFRAQRPNFVILIAGFGSTWEGNQDLYANLRAELRARGWTDSQLMPFSYAGNTAAGCGWGSENYSKIQTTRGTGPAFATIGSLIQSMSQQCPGRRVALVGHSLGGILAFAAAIGDGTGSVVAAATIDAPLGGVDPAILQECASLSIGPCQMGDGATLQDLARAYRERASYVESTQRAVRQFARQGGRLAAFGNQADCVYMLSQCNLQRAGALDNRWTQWFFVDGLNEPGVSVRKYDTAAETNRCPRLTGALCVGDSHSALLKFWPQGVADIAAFIGSPG